MPDRKYRIAHVITRMCRGGAQENTLLNVAWADVDRYDVDLYCGPVPRSEIGIMDRVRDAGVEPILVPTLRRTPNPIADLNALSMLTRTFREKDYDLVHTHTSKAGFIGRMAARRAGVKHIVHTPHGHIFHGYFTVPVVAIYTQLERRAARYSDRIIALTGAEIDQHLDRGVGTRDRFVSIPSGIDVDAFENAESKRNEARADLGVNDCDCVVIGAGRLEPVKGFTYFIRAAAMIADRHPSLLFWIAGDGSCRGDLERQARESNVEIAFLGWRDDLDTLFAAADIFVLPSMNEGMGRVIAEAGAAGLPVVAARTGGIPDIVRDGETGLLVPPGDAQAMADAIEELAENPSRRADWGRAARAHIRAGFSAEAMVQRIESVYEELLSE